jgi:hypothetical protein
MSEIIETIFNCETGEVTEILSTPEYEAEQVILMQKEQEFQDAIAAQEAIIEANRQAVLAKLGISADEAKLLLS